MKHSESNTYDSRYCPSCGKSNDCAVAALNQADNKASFSGDVKPIKCWCMDESFLGVPSGTSASGVSCYCPACLKKQKSNNSFA